MVESDSGDDDPVETDLQREDLPDQAGVNFDDLTLNAVRRRLGTIMTLWAGTTLADISHLPSVHQVFRTGCMSDAP